MKKITIAIDGHSSGGKSTMAKDLAKEIGYVYIDSGAMYRAVTLYALENHFFNNGLLDKDLLKKAIKDIRISFQRNDHTDRPDTYLNGINVEKDIRRMEVSENVSTISTLDFVRKALVEMQQEMGKNKGVVMDGRDIGTVVFPNAELKVFVTAKPEIRAQRRVEELRTKGENVSFEEVLANIHKRDHIDSTRKESPLRQAEDALVLDNSFMSAAEQKEWLLVQFKRVVNDK